MNNVQVLGKVTLEPRVRELQHGKVAEFGIGIPESHRKENGEWQTKMHFVDVVVWNDMATLVSERLKKGSGALVQGMLQFEQWEAKDGTKRSRLRVKGLRVQPVLLPAPARGPEPAAAGAPEAVPVGA